MSTLTGPKVSSSALLGAAFLMATSAIGPGFIIQTTVFTQKLGTSFGFVILCSIVLDIVVQLNIWRVVSVSGLRAQDLANQFLPGAGYVLSALILLGGLAFNIGNIAGAALGIQVLTGLDLWIGAIISVLIALFIFWYKEAGKAMDIFTKILGLLMIALTAYIVYKSNPPAMLALKHSFLPEMIDTTAIIILVGGTVGGYISFAGVHRLIDAGIKGKENIKEVSRAGLKGIVVTTIMRILLFMAALGIVVQGATLDPANPAASVFQVAAGQIGYKIFGVVLWAAAITSVVGSAYTSVSFLKSFNSFFEKNQSGIIMGFIVFSAIIFLAIGKPVNILVIVGAVNAFILPLALGIILLASTSMKFMNGYRHPRWLQISGWMVVLILSIMCFQTVMNDLVGLWK